MEVELVSELEGLSDGGKHMLRQVHAVKHVASLRGKGGRRGIRPCSCVLGQYHTSLMHWVLGYIANEVCSRLHTHTQNIYTPLHCTHHIHIPPLLTPSPPEAKEIEGRECSIRSCVYVECVCIHVRIMVVKEKRKKERRKREREREEREKEKREKERKREQREKERREREKE